MFCSSPEAEKAIPEEYRPLTSALFSKDVKRIALGSVEGFAEALGIGAQFRRSLADGACNTEAPGFRRLLHQFQNNFDLLIAKTWVEEDDVQRKNRLQDRLPAFIGLIEGGRLTEALRTYGEILEELAWLIFGGQSQCDDFTEYALRMDTQMGLFWYYGGQIGRVAGQCSQSSLAPLLLVGLCYLENL